MQMGVAFDAERLWSNIPHYCETQYLLWSTFSHAYTTEGKLNLNTQPITLLTHVTPLAIESNTALFFMQMKL